MSTVWSCVYVWGQCCCLYHKHKAGEAGSTTKAMHKHTTATNHNGRCTHAEPGHGS